MHKILIANRGEIARRIMRTCREMGLATVAVFSDADRDNPFVREADEAVPLGGLTPAESYLRIERIIEAAQLTGADAIHPGYGFLAENADFAVACAEAGIKLIGPPIEAIRAMGSKIEAKRRMKVAGVPVLPSVDVTQQSAAELCEEAAQLGFPLLVKASAGGGGRGMRVVEREVDLAEAVAAARGEAKSAFGDESVFIEPYVQNPRHIEIQIFGDAHGNCVHLFERECSIQRRHQKIVEEAPSVALDPQLRQHMGEVAARAGSAIGYQGAGTVEFLLTPAGKFYFLEVNTRLQVEHPVTECITGLDLVRLQILVAQGEPLPPEALQPRMAGHAIEVRLYAEDPTRDWLPMTGTVERFQLPELPGLRIESGIESGQEVSPYYDPMLAKLIVYAPTRTEAARRLAAALAAAQIHGLRTNRELLVRLLRHPEFLAGQTDTGFLSRHDPAELGRPLADEEAERLHALAATLAAQAAHRAAAPRLARIPSGWRNNPSQLNQVKFTSDSGELTVGYRLDRQGLIVEFNGTSLADVALISATPDQVVLRVGGVQRTYAVHRVGCTCYVDSPLGSSVLQEQDPFPSPDAELEAGSLVAPFPGVVAEVKAAVGDRVAQGDTLLVIESMKMLHPVRAPVAGQLAELRVAAGGQVETNMILAVIDEQAEE